jgi:leucyl aminopeptidase (aminopeptidase T)
MEKWTELARRIVLGLDVQPGEIVQVRGDPGPLEFLLEMLLAIEIAGATPLPELFTAQYLQRLWAEASLETLAHWDRHRGGWLEQVDRIVTFMRPDLPTSTVFKEKRAAWVRATGRLDEIEERRLLPFLVVALPTEAWAGSLGLPCDEVLERVLLPALTARAGELQGEIARVLEAVDGRHALVVCTGEGCELRLNQGDRAWLSDDGMIDADDRRRGAIVSNLPAGSIYTTILEGETQGRLWLPQVLEAREVTFHFAGGRIVEVEAARGAEAVRAWLSSHSGEPGRVSHIGIGLNPYLPQPTGWNTIIDEHVHGSLFLALGENRYMGGQNESSLNHDFAIHDASLLAGGKKIVSWGKLCV